MIFRNSRTCCVVPWTTKSFTKCIRPSCSTRKKRRLPNKFPLLPVRDLVVFPRMVVPLDVSRTKSVKALEEAMAAQHLVFVASQKHAETEDPQGDDIFQIGTTAKILELLKMPNGQLKILVEGQSRGKVTDFRSMNAHGFIEVDVEVLKEKVQMTPEFQVLLRQA